MSHKHRKRRPVLWHFLRHFHIGASCAPATPNRLAAFLATIPAADDTPEEPTQ